MLKKVLLFTFSIFLGSLVMAQQSGKISGTVTDAQTGEPLPGANILVEGTTYGASADAQGHYNILQVPPGTYSVSASYIGYSELRKNQVQVTAGLTTRLNFALQTSAIEGQVVQVTVQRPLVEPTATNAVRTMTREEFQNIATRNAQTFYAIQSGVTVQNGQVHIRGSRSDETGYMLEGASTKSLVGADNVVNVIPEALEQVQVLAGGYAADQGGSNAGIIQQTLRTGGTKFSGSAQYENDGVATAFNNTYSYGYNDLTLTLGGPLISKRHRFFVALENTKTDNYNPQYWYGGNFGYLYDDNTPTDSALVKWGGGNLPGIQRPENQLKVNGTLLFDFNPLRFRLGIANTTRDRRLNDYPIYTLFNQARIPKRQDLRRTISLKSTYFFSDKTFLDLTLSNFAYNFEIYDPNFAKPSADGKGGAIVDLLKYVNKDAVGAAGLDSSFFRGPYTLPTDYLFHTFAFQRPGDIVTDPNGGGYYYQRREQSYYDVALDFVSQQEAHELKFGANYKRWTARNYYFGAGGFNSLGQLIASGATVGDIPYKDAVAQGNSQVARDIRLAGYGGYGYDEFMNKVDSGPNGPKHPVTTSLYINDKIELNDIVVNAGIRYDRFDMDAWDLNPMDPGYIQQQWTIAKDQLKKQKPRDVVQPRLGFAFPVTDKTVFHLQYGKFAQMPDMFYVYRRLGLMALDLNGQNFIPTPFGFNLDPIRTTQYEIGFSNQFTNYASFDITAYYKNTTGQLEIVRQQVDPSSQSEPYNRFVNGDFTFSRGIEITLKTRRIKGLLAQVNYTLNDSKGTNSEPGGQVSALENNYAPPTMVQPLTYQQRHRGSVQVDYRTNPNKGPLLGDWGINLLAQFNSGHPYTLSTGAGAQRSAWQGAILTDADPRNRTPLEPINASSTPWQFYTDLRVEKGFDIGPVRAIGYVYVENLFNRKNVINVYLRTGSAANDGWLTTPELSSKIVAAQGQTYVDLYRAINLQDRENYQLEFGNDLYGAPRQARLGIRLEF